MIKKLLLAGLAALSIFAVVLLLHGPSKVNAGINYNNLMDDYIFENTSSMNAAQIDTFLNNFPNSCISQNPNGNGNPGFMTADPQSTSSYGGNVTAGKAIYDTAQLYHINPQVILAMLQKEQSIVTGSAGCHYNSPDPSTATSMTDACGNGTKNCTLACTFAGGCMNIAMSYGCPNYCNVADETFSQQIALGAWVLRFAEERSEGKTTGYIGYETGDSGFTYSGLTVGVPGSISDGNTITALTGATASLYSYNPFESPNLNYVNIFQSWFGPTTGQGYELVDDSTCVSACSQYVIYGSIKQYVSGSIKTAWGLPDQPTPVDPSVLSTYSTGPNLGLLATLNTNSVKTVDFMDGGHRYRIPWPSMMDTWNLRGQVISDVSPGLFNQPTDSGDLTNVIQSPSSSTTFYMVDGSNGNGGVMLRQYSSDTVRQAWEGNLAYTPISSSYFNSLTTVGSTLTSTSGSCSGTNFQANAGGKLIQSAAIGALFPTIQSVSAATCARLTTTGAIGSLIQSASNPTVYLMDGGLKRQILWPNALDAWAAGGQAITQVSDSFISALSNGTSIGSYLAEDGSSNYYVIDHGTKYPVPASLVTAYSHSMTTVNVSNSLVAVFPTGYTVTGFVQAQGLPSLYLLDNSGNLHHLPNPTVAALWGVYQNGISRFDNYVVTAMPASGADAKVYVNDGTATNYVVDVGKLASVSGSVATDWGLSSPQVYADGTLSRLATGTALTNQVYDGAGRYFWIRGGTAYATTDPNIAGIWNLVGNTSMHNGSLVSNLMTVYGLTRFVQSSTNSNNYYVIDNNGVNATWYLLPGQFYADIIPSNYPLTILNPSLAANTGTWAGLVITNGGNYYAIDGSTKRLLPAGAIRNQWTTNQTTTDQAASSYFLNLLPTGANMERAIKGSSPSIYSVEGEVKRHILSSTVYNQSYAPFTAVSDALINAMPSGSDI